MSERLVWQQTLWANKECKIKSNLASDFLFKSSGRTRSGTKCCNNEGKTCISNWFKLYRNQLNFSLKSKICRWIWLGFDSPCHSLSDMKALIIEQVKIRSDEVRKEREKYFIHKIYKFYEDMNIQQKEMRIWEDLF